MHQMNTIHQLPCHKAAVLSDIHSNYPAFRACFEDAVAHGADCFIFLGDYISDLADPRRTLDLVYGISARYPTVCLRGNRERYMLDCANGTSVFSRGSKTGSLLYTFEHLLPSDLAFLESLPIYDVIRLNGIPIEIAHALKGNDRYVFAPEEDKIQNVLNRMEYSCFLSGHSHKQYIHTRHGKTIINPGSIGVPRDHGYLTQYALLEIDSSGIHCQLRQLPYDIESTIRSQFASGLTDYARFWATSILYDVITGTEYTGKLLHQVCLRAGENEAAVCDEALWQTCAEEMGIRYTEQEILDFLKSRKA